jgi:hypothetical protein
MSDYLYAIERDIIACRAHAVHKIRHAYKDKGWYRMGISLEGFNKFCLRRFLSSHKETGGYYYDSSKHKHHKKNFSIKYCSDEYESDQARYIDKSDSCTSEPQKSVYRVMSNVDLPQFEHESVYAFYEFIGYERKTKTFSKPNLSPC